MGHMIGTTMEAIIHTNSLVVTGNTYDNTDLLKRLGFTWNPNHRVWYHPDLNKTQMLPRNTRIYDVRKLYFMKRAYEDRKVAILKACESLPTDITKNIFSQIHFNRCRCAGKWVCFDCQYSCCELAIPILCVCLHATNCPKHGRRCNGSHD